jgi:hypothetical protein
MRHSPLRRCASRLATASRGPACCFTATAHRHCLARGVDAVQREIVPCQIDAKSDNSHGLPLRVS